MITAKDLLIERMFLVVGTIMTIALLLFLRFIVGQVRADTKAGKAAELADKSGES